MTADEIAMLIIHARFLERRGLPKGNQEVQILERGIQHIVSSIPLSDDLRNFADSLLEDLQALRTPSAGCSSDTAKNVSELIVEFLSLLKDEMGRGVSR